MGEKEKEKEGATRPEPEKPDKIRLLMENKDSSTKDIFLSDDFGTTETDKSSKDKKSK